MGRSPCCSEGGLNRGAWTAAENKILTDYVNLHGEGSWRNLPKRAGLKRCGKSCRLRWLNYLRPNIKRGNISHDEEELIVRLHKLLGNRWSLIAGRLPGRTDNEIKNYWNTNLCKKVHADHSSNQPVNNMNKNESQVVRTESVRCTTKESAVSEPGPYSQPQTSPQPNTTEPIDNNLSLGPPNTTTISLAKPLEQSIPWNGLSLFSLHDNNPTSDFMSDINMENVFLSDLLNSDFSGLCDFNCISDKNIDPLSASSDGLMFFSKDMMEDLNPNDCLQPNVASNHHGFPSFLESGGHWPAE